jgi:hypothetical protein
VCGADGSEIPEPRRADFGSDVDYLRAWWAWDDRVRSLAHAAFDRAFRRALRRRE